MLRSTIDNLGNMGAIEKKNRVLPCLSGVFDLASTGGLDPHRPVVAVVGNGQFRALVERGFDLGFNPSVATEGFEPPDRIAIDRLFLGNAEADVIVRRGAVMASSPGAPFDERIGRGVRALRNAGDMGFSVDAELVPEFGEYVKPESMRCVGFDVDPDRNVEVNEKTNLVPSNRRVKDNPACSSSDEGSGRNLRDFGARSVRIEFPFREQMRDPCPGGQIPAVEVVLPLADSRVDDLAFHVKEPIFEPAFRGIKPLAANPAHLFREKGGCFI